MIRRPLSIVRHALGQAALVTIPYLFMGFIADDARAEPFAMHSELRNFCCTDWLGRTSTPTPQPNPGGGAFGFIGGVVEQAATVARTADQTLATPPLALAMPASRVGVQFSVQAFPHPNPLIDLLTLVVSLDNRAAVFEAGGGPGSFEFCPESAFHSLVPCAVAWPSTCLLYTSDAADES